mmetsp:Transcript_25228/g.30483  ORF Transcript_25228/g.30483 Transcript_25228/m.30483 type:complete len:423 (-) Transcript_25228:102-1370(-)|eukprot:CAMPEP_0172499136 /NCGR_PEP_ID=MMETSP1066-20121228/122714_1 /TAXON_ID=671091 /ORGANISM="Coscinodiscus wailesii, Strain CCMP2513" /LENGTH=422 /DNA_ID=CAMNT_0013272727 /DNA_START=48 /DNA_END=1316 /DNA_ORIENTATION=+
MGQAGSQELRIEKEDGQAYLSDAEDEDSNDKSEEEQEEILSSYDGSGSDYDEYEDDEDEVSSEEGEEEKEEEEKEEEEDEDDEDGDSNDLSAEDDEDEGEEREMMVSKENENIVSEENEEHNGAEASVTTNEEQASSSRSVDFTKLSKEELKTRLSQVEITIPVLRRTNQFLCLTRGEEQSLEFYYNPGGSTATADEEIGKRDMQIALFLLKVSSNLRSLRFKMVPAKLSESEFWSATFYLLEHGSAPSLEDAVRGQADEKYKKRFGNNAEIRSMTMDEKDAKIHNLQKQILRMEEAMEKMRLQLKSGSTSNYSIPTTPSISSTTATSSISDSTATLSLSSPQHQQHKGKWIMDAQCQEFHDLEEDVKQQLREGKQKRIQDVMDQMKFILDSDDLNLTSGHWDCCGETVYDNGGTQKGECCT